MTHDITTTQELNAHKTNKMNNAIVTPIKHSDVRGNGLLYLKIAAGEKEVLINIGQKTFDSVTELLQPKKTQPVTNADKATTGGKLK